MSFSKAQKTEVISGYRTHEIGHRVARGPGGAPQRADQLSHGALQVPPARTITPVEACCSSSGSVVGCSST